MDNEIKRVRCYADFTQLALAAPATCNIARLDKGARELFYACGVDLSFDWPGWYTIETSSYFEAQLRYALVLAGTTASGNSLFIANPKGRILCGGIPISPIRHTSNDESVVSNKLDEDGNALDAENQGGCQLIQRYKTHTILRLRDLRINAVVGILTGIHVNEREWDKYE